MHRQWSFILLVLALTGPAAARWHRHRVLVCPSPRHPTIQRAIDAAPDGATVRIRAGTYDVDEPLVVRGKRLRIVGAGSGLEPRRGRGGFRRRITHLRGPGLRERIDSRSAKGCLHYVDAGGILANLKISNFDAGITSGETDEAPPADLEMDNVAVSDSGYGAIWASPAQLVVTVKDVGDIGILVDTGGECVEGSDNLIEDTEVYNCGGPGIVVFFGGACIRDSVIGGCQGGIWIIKSAAWVQECELSQNSIFGVGVFESGAKDFEIRVEDCHIANTVPHHGTGRFGDGILARSGQVRSWVIVRDTLIEGSARAGIGNFGSTVDLGGTTINNSAYDLEGEIWQGFDFDFIDSLGNVCDGGACEVVSAGLEPPPPVTPIQ